MSLLDFGLSPEEILTDFESQSAQGPYNDKTESSPDLLAPSQYSPQAPYDFQASSDSASSQRSGSRAESSITSYSELSKLSEYVTGHTAGTALDIGNAKQPPEIKFDTSGQVAPAGMKPRVTATLWEDEGSVCFQVEAKGVTVARREDNRMINGTRLLDVAGMTRGRRDGILKSEIMRHVVKTGPKHLKGVWLPFERALDFANKERITELMYPLFVHNIDALLYHPINQTRTNAVMAAAERLRLEQKEGPKNVMTFAERQDLERKSPTRAQAVHIHAPYPGRAAIFPTPPTTSSNLMGTMVSSNERFGRQPQDSLSRAQAVHPWSIMARISGSQELPVTPETTPPGSPTQSMQQYQQSSYSSLPSNLDAFSPVHTTKDIRQIVLDRLSAFKNPSDSHEPHNWTSSRKRTRLDYEQLGKTQVNTEPCNASVQKSRAKFRVLWEANDSLMEQFGTSKSCLLGSVITLTGTGRYAQATTVQDYLKLNWPATGRGTLRLIEELIAAGWDTTKVFSRDYGNDSRMSLRYCKDQQLLVDVKDTDDLVVEIAQQLAWLGCVLRRSKNGQVGRCQVQISTQHGADEALFELRFEADSLPPDEDFCWHELFVDPSIAYKFPIPSRGGELGLEISVPMMAALGGASRAVEFEGGLLIKGFSSAFVPLAKSGDSIQWHYIRNEDGSRLSYQQAVKLCPGRALLDTIDQDVLSLSRAFLGWWDKTTTHLGTADVNYDNLDWSPARESRRSTSFSGGSVGFQYFGTGELSFSVGPKDSKLHISRTGSYEKIIDYASITPTVLYDTVECRGWLVPTSAVIAHIVQKSHARKPFRVAGKRIDITPVDPVSDVFEGAMHMLLANAKIKLRDSEDVQSEFCFKHAVLDIWTLLECIMDRDVQRETSAEIEVGMPMSRTLRGWEFMDLVVGRSPLRQKETDIKSTSGNWMDLTADINAIVLFASGFEDMIRPAENSTNGICHAWKQVPKYMDYLVAGIPMLNSLYEQAGSRLTKEHLTSTHIQWSRGPMLFEKCQRNGQFQCTCDRLQKLVTKSRFLTVRPPGPLSEHGAVIFGQAKNSIGHNRLNPGKDKETSLYSQTNTPLLAQTGPADPLCSNRSTVSGSLTPSLEAEGRVSSSSDSESEDANGSSLGPAQENANMRTAKRGRENSDYALQHKMKARRSSPVQGSVKKRIIDSGITIKVLNPDDILSTTCYSLGAQSLPQTHAIRRKPNLQQAEIVSRRTV